MDYNTFILTENDCFKANKKMKPAGIVVHSTGANNKKLSRYINPNDGRVGTNKYNNHWNRSGVKKCVHAFIGEDVHGVVCTYQTLPLDICAWGVGNGKNGSYNYNPAYLQFEICEDDLTDLEYYKKVMREAQELCAKWCNEFNIPIENVISHKEANKRGYGSNHGDIDHWLAKFGHDMDDFRAEVKAIIEGKETTVYVPTVKEWQNAAIFDGFKFPKYGPDGKWGKECEGVAAAAVVKKRIVYKYKNLTKIVQRVVGAKVDGKCGKDTEAAIKKYQKAQGLAADGAVGLNTWKKILKIK